MSLLRIAVRHIYGTFFCLKRSWFLELSYIFVLKYKKNHIPFSECSALAHLNISDTEINRIINRNMFVASVGRQSQEEPTAVCDFIVKVIAINC